MNPKGPGTVKNQGRTEVRIDEVVPGTILGAPVLNSSGKILLREGVTLSSSLLERLTRWGVGTITLLDQGSKQDSGPTPAPAQDTDSAHRDGGPWGSLFQPHQESPEMRIIHQALLRWKAEGVS